jgi:DNA-binding MarR family transcriptional regulator
MNNTDSGKQNNITLRILDEISRASLITQRDLSSRLGIALGLVNTYIKRLAKKGHIKITTIPKNRVKYILTPKGFSEKVRLTYEFMHYSMDFFKDVRKRIDHIYKKMISQGVKDILIWGDGEIAELSYISLRGLPLNLVGVIDSKRQEQGFFGLNVYSFDELPYLRYDAILLTFFNNEAERKRMQDLGVQMDKIYSL